MPYYNPGINFVVYPMIQGDIRYIFGYNPTVPATR